MLVAKNCIPNCHYKLPLLTNWLKQMKNKHLMILLSWLFSVTCAAQTSLTVTIINPVQEERKDQPVVVGLSPYDLDVVRAVVTREGREIPCQLDDLDGDCRADELCFLVNVEPRESQAYQVMLYEDGRQARYTARTHAQLILPSRDKKRAKNRQDTWVRSITFAPRTKDPYHYVHAHGVCFESELVALRVYYDHRQTVDIYGKPRKGLILEATQFYPDSAQLAAGMGDDVLWVGDTYGLGALRGWDGSRSLQLDSVRWRTQRVVAEGPLRAIVEVEDLGYVPAPGLKPVNMVIRYTLYAGHRDVDVDVTFDRDVSAYRFATGIINVKNSTEYTDHQGLRGCYGTDWPTGKDDGKHKQETVGLGIYVPGDYLDSELPANKDDYTMVVRPRGQSLHYKLAYTSANEDFGFRGEREWYAWLWAWRQSLSMPLRVTVSQ